MDTKAIILGGLIPAFLLGIGTVLMKLSLKNGMPISLYVAIVGFAVSFIGIIATYFTETYPTNSIAVLYAIAMGITWSLAILLMSYGISVLNVPVSIIAPLTNSNAIVAVLLSAIIFAEYHQLDFKKVIIGTLLIVLGAIVVSSSSK